MFNTLHDWQNFHSRRWTMYSLYAAQVMHTNILYKRIAACYIIRAFDISINSYPVALDARAELLESRALTSMMQYSKDDGCRAYWMLHSPTMPRWRTTLIAVSLSMWYSSLDNVWLGATTMESPFKEMEEDKRTKRKCQYEIFEQKMDAFYFSTVWEYFAHYNNSLHFFIWY